MARILAIAACAAFAAGCTPIVEREKYERDIEALKAHNNDLRARLAELEKLAAAYDEMVKNQTIAKSQDEMYDEIARQLSEALDGLRGPDGSGMFWNPKIQGWELGTDLLVDSGSFTLTPRGLEALRKLADAYRSQPVKFRIVGHTDNARVVTQSTKDKLATDTNLELSVRRAEAVFAALLKMSLKDARFYEISGMGNMRPAAPNDSSAANRKRNRRVEIFIVKDAARNGAADR
jgi:flagellar motor protein MotB